MSKTVAAFAAGLLLLASAPALAGPGGCGTFTTQSVDRDDKRTVATSGQSTPVPQTASTQSSGQ